MRELGELDPRYVSARRALLDVLEALGPHRDAVVLVGAQAVYLNVGQAGAALSSFTSDADLALNPELLAHEPALESVLSEAGFHRKAQPGLWFDAKGVEVDLLVPASIAGQGRRGANLGQAHDRKAAMRAAGLEAALVDNSPHRIAALDGEDSRSFLIPVAGPAALLVSKLHKIGERNDESPHRLKNKDASDLFLLLQNTETASMAKTLRELAAHDAIRPTIDRALQFLSDLFAKAEGAGLELLRGAVQGIEDEQTAVASCSALSRDLLEDVRWPSLA